jgi:hypothetical protein
MGTPMEIDVKERERMLRTLIERALPDFVKSVREAPEAVVIHQDAFAADYNEYELLGMAIKFAGLYGKAVHIIGKNRETLAKPVVN